MKPNTSLPPGPVAIGGLGGSGTRLFASALQVLGYEIGPRVNKSLDDLWFSFLFKRFDWVNSPPKVRDVAFAIRLFQKAKTIGLRNNVSQEESELIRDLRKDLKPIGDWKFGPLAHEAKSILQSCMEPRNDHAWAWKEPNTHVFLRELNETLPNLKYIHVFRNGLDMSFSKNLSQAMYWGPRFGMLKLSRSPDPQYQLKYWRLANEKALSYGKVNMPGRFLAMSFERFCEEPKDSWETLQAFLGIQNAPSLPENFVRPTGIGRSLDNDLSAFDAAEMELTNNLLINLKNQSINV